MALIDNRTPLSLAETLGAMLSAVVEAQRQAARATVEFVEEIGLEETPVDGSRPLRTVQIRYAKLNENFESAEYVLDVPLLSMVNVPTVAVKEATVVFDWEVTESAAAPKSSAEGAAPARGAAPSGLAQSRFAVAPKTASLRGRVVRTKPPPKTSGSSPDTGRERAAMEVTVTLERTEPPVGLDRLLDVLEVAASETPAPGGATDNGNGGS